MMSETILEVKNLQVEFGGKKVIENVSFSVEKGDSLAIIGPNGSGKTTLFRALIGAVPYSGEIKFSRDVRMGYVPQKIDLERDLPITVEEFFKLKSTALPGKKHIQEALSSVRLSPSYAQKPIGGAGDDL